MTEITLPPLPESPPAKLWELVHMAHGDLRLRERDERYEVDMGWYHAARPSGKCSVCLAGCMISRELPPTSSTFPIDFCDEWRDAFYVLDCIRMDRIEDAIELFYRNRFYDVSNKLDGFYTELEGITDAFAEYEDDRVAFHIWLYKLTDLLQKHGI